MRAFVAIPLTAEVRDRVDLLQREWRTELPSARWVRPESVHLTLRFLGETSDGKADALARRLEKGLGDTRPFGLRFRGVGCFPSPRRARVVWVGLDEPPPPLFAAQKVVERAARATGFPEEARPFRAHLTIARIQGAAPNLPGLVEAAAGRPLGEMIAAEIVLFESRLLPSGARHEPRARISLGPCPRG